MKYQHTFYVNCFQEYLVLYSLFLKCRLTLMTSMPDDWFVAYVVSVYKKVIDALLNTVTLCP